MAKKRKSRVSLILITGLLFIFISTIVAINTFSSQFEALKNSLGDYGWVPKIAENALQSDKSASTNLKVKYKFAILSDTHEDLTVYPKIVDQIKSRTDLAFVVHLGDQSNAGDSNKLLESKKILDGIQAQVYVLPGDHDSNWVPRRDLTNFKQVYNLNRTSYAITHDTEKYIFLDNSDGSDGISGEVWDWLGAQLENSENQNIYIFMSTPLSNPYLQFKTMGSQSDEVKRQAEKLGKLLKEHHIKAIFAGDTHTFSQYKDKSTDLSIITVGAAGANKNPLPLYVEVEILSDGSYNVSSIPLQQ